MNVYPIQSKGGSIIGVFNDFQKDSAARIARDIGGKVLGPFLINKVQGDIPLEGKQYFELVMFKSGTCNATTNTTLTEDGQRRPEQYCLETYAKNRGKFGRKSHWRLLLCCYAKSENEAKDIAKHVRKVLEKEPDLSKGKCWRDLTTGEELEPCQNIVS